MCVFELSHTPLAYEYRHDICLIVSFLAEVTLFHRPSSMAILLLTPFHLLDMIMRSSVLTESEDNIVSILTNTISSI